MIISELWRHYESDKRIQWFSPNTLKAYALQLRMLVRDLGDLEISEIPREGKIICSRYSAKKRYNFYF